MNKLIIIIGASLLLTSCALSPPPTSTVRVISSNSYPVLPDIKPVDQPDLQPWQHDVPRNTEKVVIKNLTDCLKVKKENQDDSFWVKCGENPILEKSNIFVGFDQDNWNIIITNFAKLRAALYEYEQRILSINEQRRKWREQAEAERRRLDAENQEANEKKSEPEKKKLFGIF